LACTRIAGAVSVVKLLVKSMGDEAKLMKDNVRFVATCTYIIIVIIYYSNMASSLPASAI
jgi:hypothetical protein